MYAVLLSPTWDEVIKTVSQHLTKHCKLEHIRVDYIESGKDVEVRTLVLPFYIIICHGNEKGLVDEHGRKMELVVSGRVIVAIACWTAREYGKECIKNGARAYLGWNKPVVFSEKYIYETLKPLVIILTALDMGASLGEAVVLAQSYIHDIPDKLPEHVKKLVLQNINGIRLYGDRTASINNVYIAGVVDFANTVPNLLDKITERLISSLRAEMKGVLDYYG